MQLTEHFSLEELSRSDTAARLGIDNSPPSELLPNLLRLAQKLEQVRTLLEEPLLVTSGFRSKRLNLATPGSAIHSAHTLGLAADFHIASASAYDLCKKVSAMSSVVFDQLIYEYQSWCHLSVDLRSRRQLLTKKHGEAYKDGINV